MGRTSKNVDPLPSEKTMPALSIEARENEMVALAIDRAEQQLRDGTASAQVIVHYLKLGSSNQRLENEKLKTEIEQMKAKIDQLKSAKKVEELYSEALAAMREYSGRIDD